MVPLQFHMLDVPLCTSTKWEQFRYTSHIKLTINSTGSCTGAILDSDTENN